MSGENKKSNRFFLHKNRLQTCINNLQIVLTQQIYEKKQSVVAGLERFRWLATSKQNDEMCAILYACLLYTSLGRSQLNGTVYLCFGHNAHEYSWDVYKFNPEEFRFIPLNTLLPDRYPGITRSYASF